MTAPQEFARWFAGSQVVEADGQPRRLFHATETDFADFATRRSELGAHFGTEAQAATFAEYSDLGQGFRILPVYLAIKNPLRLIDLGAFDPARVVPQLQTLGILPSVVYPSQYFGESGVRALQNSIRAAGFDGVVYLNRREGNPSVEGFSRTDLTTLNALTDEEVRRVFPEVSDSYIAFRPEQIRSAFAWTPNRIQARRTESDTAPAR